jgi:hypothetical protein
MNKVIALSAALLAAACLRALAHEGHAHSAEGQGQPGMEGMAMPLDAAAVQPPRPPQSEWKVMWSHLKQPEYIHVVINAMPLAGMGLGAGLILAGLWLESDGMREGGLALVVLAGAITFPTIKFGQHAYDRLYDRIPLEAQQWLDVHMSRAERLQWFFYLTGALAAWALASSRMKKPSAVRQARAALVAAGLCAVLAGWISHAGGQVRHSEFRMGPPMHNAKPMLESRRQTEP